MSEASADPAALRSLLELTGSRRPPDGAALPEQVKWLEELTQVAERALKDAPARTAITDLRAALGAVVQWGRGPRTPESLVELELVFRALVARGSVGLFEAIARALDTLAELGVERDNVQRAARAYADAAQALAQGRAVDAAHVEAMQRVQREVADALREA